MMGPEEGAIGHIPKFRISICELFVNEEWLYPGFFGR